LFGLEICLSPTKEQLQDVLEGWLILGLRLQHQLPIVDGINLTPQQKIANRREHLTFAISRNA
jgi:hypothetical protein